MANSIPIYHLLLAFLAALTLSQKIPASFLIQPLLLEQPYTVELPADQLTTWSVALPQGLTRDKDLFIKVQSPPNHPLQQPSLSIKTSKEEILRCDTANNEFAGICRVDRSKLLPGLALYVTAKCIVGCHLTLTATIESRLTLELGKSMTLRSPSDSAGYYQFEMMVPEDAEFSELAVFAQINDFSEVAGGLEIYGNIGDEHTLIPSRRSHKFAGKSIFWGGQGLFFSKEDFESNRWIKLAMTLYPGTEVKLFTQLSTHKSTRLKLQEDYFGYTTGKEQKKYYLDLSQQRQNLKGKTIGLKFITYSGDPQFTVAFDEHFNSKLRGRNSEETLTYLITEDMRRMPAFKDALYISVSSGGNADYYLHSALHDKDHIVLVPEVPYYTQLSIGKVFNYFFQDVVYVSSQDEQSANTRNYSLKIHYLKGQGNIVIRECQPAKEGAPVSSCALASLGELPQQDLIPATTKTIGQYQELIWQYKLGDCQQVQTVLPQNKAFYCSFHVSVSNKEPEQLEYTLKWSKRANPTLLKEGQLHRDSIFKQQQLYYRFGVTHLQDVVEVAFFITMIEGNVVLLASTINPFPSSDQLADLKSDTSNRIVFTKSQLSNNFYLAVESSEFSEFTVGVVVVRQNPRQTIGSLQGMPDINPHKVSKVRLQEGLSLDYVLRENDAEARFLITPLKDEIVQIELIQLVGDIKMELYTTRDQVPKCAEKDPGSTTLACKLELKAEDTIEVVVKGDRGSQQQFVVMYYKMQACIPYSLNLPLYKELAPHASGCISYSITHQDDLVLSTSVAIERLLQGHLKLELCVKDKCLQRSTSHHESIQKQMLAVLCQFHQESRENCPITVTFSNLSPSKLEFYLILQQQGLNIGLLDGISERISSEELSETKPKKLYYEVVSDNTIKIFFTSLTSDHYIVLAHFLPKQDFLSAKEHAYPTLQDRDQDDYYQFSKKGPGSNIFAISSIQVQRNCHGCILTLSVFSTDRSAPSYFSAFQIEVSQEETVIKIGESKFGYLQRGDVYVYELQQPREADAVVSIRDLNKESGTQSKCFEIRRTELQNTTNAEVAIINQQAQDPKLYVTAVKPICYYQISYSHLGRPVINAIPNHHYPFQIEPDSTTYFIYTHNSDHSFKVIQLLNNGEAHLFITPIQHQKKLQEILSARSPSSFSFTGDESQSEVLVMKNSTQYCSGCSYLIGISSKNGAKGELLVTPLKAKVPLSANSLLREKIIVNEESTRRYNFNCQTSFNLNLNVIHGKITVTVFDSKEKIVQKRDVYGSASIGVENIRDSLERLTFEFKPLQNQYSINVQALVDSYFTIKPSTIAITHKLFEGISLHLSLQEKQHSILQFENTNLIDPTKSLSVVIQMVHRFYEEADFPEISINSLLSASDGSDPVPIEILSRSDSEGAISLQLPARKGYYYLNVSSNKQVYLTLLLVKQSLIHLKPESRLLMTKPGTIELYSPKKAVMMEVFTCSGHIEVEASDQYRDFISSNKSSKDIALERSNYGGHFVISSDKLEGQYYMRVNNKDPSSTEVSYLLNYYYFNEGEPLPYKLIDLRSPEVSYTLGTESITFRISQIVTKDLRETSIRDLEVEYRFYFANSRTSIAKYSNCRLDKVISGRGSTSGGEDHVEFTLKMADLQNLESLYFAGAEAVVKIVADNSQVKHYPRELSLLYDTVEVSNTHAKPDGYSAKTLIFLMLLPFLLAALTLYLGVKYCIGKYRGMVPDELVEQPNTNNKAESEEAVNSAAITDTAKETAGALKEDVTM